MAYREKPNLIFYRKHHLPGFVPLRGNSLAAHFEKAWPRSLDSDADDAVVDRSHVSGGSDGEVELLCDSLSSGNA